MENTRSSRSARFPARVARLACVATLAVGLAAATAATADVPKIERVVSPGGIEAWLMRYDDAPLITMRLSFSGGTLQEPKEKYGLASMAAYMFNEGAGPYDAPELGRRRSRIGVNLSASSGNRVLRGEFLDAVHVQGRGLRALAARHLRAALRRRADGARAGRVSRQPRVRGEEPGQHHGRGAAQASLRQGPPAGRGRAHLDGRLQERRAAATSPPSVAACSPATTSRSPLPAISTLRPWRRCSTACSARCLPRRSCAPRRFRGERSGAAR